MKRIRYLTLLWMLFAGITGWAQDFNPTSPSEPGQLTTKLKLNVSPSGAGSTSGSGNYVSGTSVTVSASASTGWTFVNWTDANGEVVATTRSYTFTKDEKSEALTANFAFDPNGPGEPSELPHKLTLVAGEGGSVSGSGFYLNGTAVNIRAYANSYYDFEGWYDADGIRFSTEPTTTYTMGDDATTLTARFTFNPNSPSEPGEVNYLRLKLKAEEGGTVSAGKYNLKEGETTNVSAHANSGYVFSGWFEGETLVSETSSFTFTMGSSGTTLSARFIFSPSNPGEPDYIQQRKFSFTLKNAITKPGTTIQFPILLTPLSTLGDMTLQLNFDPRLNVDIDNVVLAETSTAYTLTREEVVEGDAAYDEGMTSYRFILTGGSMVVDENYVPTVTPILTFPVIIPEDIETASFYKISINQISMTTAEGTQTAGTRNGRVSVYKIGDANGDNTVDVYDYIGIANDILHVAQDGEFIREAGDVNDSGEIDVYDYIGIANLILYDNIYGNTNNASRSVTRMENTSSASDNLIYIEPFKADANSQATVSFKMKNTADIRGFQFDLYLPEGISVVKNGKNLLSDSRKPAGDQHTFTLSEQQDGAIRFLCSSINDETFTGNDGEIATLTVSIAGDMAQGDYPILLKKMKLSESNISNCYETESRMATITIGNDSATGIEQLTTGSGNETYYNLQGQRVNTPAKGVFVKNGKKVMIK